jgi:hypothetical protein
MRYALAAAATMMALAFGSAASTAALEKQQMESTKKAVTLKGRLAWKDLEGGFWAMTVKGNQYHFHGDAKLFTGVKAGDMVTVKGALFDGVCTHMYGTAITVASIRRDVKPTPKF